MALAFPRYSVATLRQARIKMSLPCALLQMASAKGNAFLES
jgi:hypothetical protein